MYEHYHSKPELFKIGLTAAHTLGDEHMALTGTNLADDTFRISL